MEWLEVGLSALRIQESLTISISQAQLPGLELEALGIIHQSGSSPDGSNLQKIFPRWQIKVVSLQLFEIGQ